MNGSLSINHNVNITIFDGQHRIKSKIHKHNKANYQLIEGIMKFIRGEFNPSNSSVDELKHNIYGAKPYIPTHISFGDGYVKQYNDNSSPPIKTIEQVVADCKDLKAGYKDTSLTHELVNSNEVQRIPISSSSFGSTTKDGFTLTLSTYIDKGLYRYQFYNDSEKEDFIPESKPIVLSELGLFSSSWDGSINSYSGNMLAKVVFTDESTVIKQDYDDIILVKWEITVSSLDDENVNNIGKAKVEELPDD